MREEKTRARLRRFQLRHSPAAHADKLESVLRQHNIVVGQPAAAGGRENALELRKGRAAPVIVIARASIDLFFYSRNESERFLEILQIFHEIAGETNEVRLESINLPNDFGGVALVA